jgi:cell division septation protein DedD
VVDYGGDASLASARRVVGDAYVRNFSSGAKIQMGAFSQPAAAQNLVNQLQQQGISAQVVGP